MKAVGHPSDKSTEPRCEDAAGIKDAEKLHARLPAQLPASNAAKISRWHRKRQERERRSARPRRREWYGDSKRDATTKGQRRYASIGHVEPDAYMTVKHSIHTSKHNVNEKFTRMLPVARRTEVKTASYFTQCGVSNGT